MSTSELSSIDFERPANSRPESHRVTILLAEDEPSLRRMLGLLLQTAGYDLMVAEDGGQALRLAKRHAGGIDMLLSDVQMPGLTGPDLAKELKRSRPALKVMLISGCAPDPGLFDGECRFLRKPFDPNTLLKEVRLTLS